MSFVVGFDFGTKNCTIAVAQKGGVDVIANEVSNRLTPSMVSFGEKERYLGEPALTNQLRNIRNTITNIKRFIGKEYKEPQVQEELKHEMFSSSELENGFIGYDVTYAGESTQFSSEAILGMLFTKLKKTTENFVNNPVRDVVISVPVFWNEYQRRAILNAGIIAGLNILRLVNETTATALSYGIYKEFSETEPTNLLFIDVGDAATSVSAVQYKKGQLKVLGNSWNSDIGSRLFDETLVKHFAKEFKAKYKIDVFENKKALIRLRVACEKVKKVLSSNNEAPISIDSLMEDKDVKGMIDRATFEELIQDDVEAITGPIKKLLSDLQMTPEQFHSIEITGGGTRSVSLQKKLVEILGRDLSRTINSEESVCRGAALQCAMLSPVFRVRPFAVNDIASYPITVNFKSVSGVEQKLELFNLKSAVPSPKPLRISFPITKSEGFEVYVNSTYGNVCTVKVDQIPSFTNKSSIKARVWLDIHGLFHIDEVKLVEQIPEEQPAAPAEGSESPAAPAEGAASPNGTPAEPAKAPEEKKVKVQESPIAYTVITKGMTKDELKNAVEEECRMQAADTLAIETSEKRNALESYIYDMRSKLTTSLKPFVTADNADKFMEKLNKAMDWLDSEEGEDQTKSVYAGKLDELTRIGNPIQKRAIDEEEYNDVAQSLKNTASLCKNEALTPGEKYDHITKEEKEKIIKDCDAAVDWIDQLLNKQKSLPKTQPLCFNIADVNSKKSQLESTTKSILGKAKPKPAPATPPPQPNPEEKEIEDQPMKESEQPKDQKMDDVDN
ncbi:hypothetical protein DICPUDRAFT_57975 [Dictyostelium purpureum]|uniref:Uncharacterized protein n=1 Tax=Dictyostelium purpureum TaxID=5786 RepID=F0ZYG3_DICPU|nr:uncharacterized protein DICPUDRAFT_57975 [Dictyostelium purpureum]EGC31016.1 hypothetical protein DICPUDRAFT_57975 [Dictyostelium purpureum]|eukprot:XP_003292454.1 hypothetical protein DICPUDRAFT_57975 [Dictyostelium purpureum]